ncbi:DUF2939 domain-containing protein [Cognatiluteimonas weifangensis]|nr:DUF2939 domain-containing protein [Luteimonas weifangensis]
MHKWIALLLAGLLLFGAWIVAGPYLTVRDIRSAVRAQDAAALSEHVDYPALRASLKAQLADRLVREAGPELQSNPLAALGLTLATGAVSTAVEAMVTPAGLAAVMQGRKLWQQVSDDFAPPDPAMPAPEPLHDARYRYESWSHCTVTIRDQEGRPLVFVLTRQGLRWRLSDLRLPQ